jgi:hypothetical protein
MSHFKYLRAKMIKEQIKDQITGRYQDHTSKKFRPGIGLFSRPNRNNDYNAQQKENEINKVFPR